MKSRKLKSYVVQRMKRFRKYALTAAYTAENTKPVHRFRVELKKLRAFLHLTNCTKSTKEPRFSPNLKKINKLAGSIRNQQLYYQAITPFCRKKKALLAETAQQIERETKTLNKAIKRFHFQKATKSILKKLPGQIRKGTLRKFIHQKSESITERLSRAVVSDNDLHTVRKNLKDIMYNLKHFRSNIPKYFPIAGTTNIQELKDLTNILNGHQDCAVWLSLLNSGLSDKLSQEDTAVLKSVGRKWKRKKTALRHYILKAIS